MRTLFTIAALAAGMLAVPSSHHILAGHDTPERIDASVAIRTFQFAPDTLRVKEGTRVSWANDDDIEHTITSGTPDKADGRFNGAVNKRGAIYSALFEKVGTYRYFCDRHRFMNGTIIVTR